ncbi:XRE family transcriptional regulator [Cereibacter sphaeroides]|uniref:helix-turn-helix domain-containing protein n=1 Tax=Cereibacter sphaeroides TaxID=1063 RepID=UPI000F5379BB|nr:helix-turn-helix transcriptional regulator [Cereibacter sphaeroides]AZB57232.1 XRE family transcriptional regulator [Cereibacter sphaeroides]AZB61516.1 XRE family transcriptional regulator [Cereibacter sphaeroides]
MSSFPDRLREERERLGLIQPELGQIGGVGKQTQINYESGKRSPDADYLTKIAAFGVDTLYLLTGVRSAQGSVADTAQKIRERFSRRIAWSAETDVAFLPIPWHELLQLPAAAPIALSEQWAEQRGLDPSGLRAVPIDRAVMKIELSGDLLAVVDATATQGSSLSPWMLIIDEMSVLAEVEFHARSMVMPRLMTDGSSKTLWDDEREHATPLGRVVWLGVSAESAP